MWAKKDRDGQERSGGGIVSWAVVLVTLAAHGASKGWKPVKVLTGIGGIDATITQIDPSWQWLKFNWTNECGGSRQLIVAALKGTQQIRIEGASSNVPTIGERWFPLPKGISSIQVTMKSGTCDLGINLVIAASSDGRPEEGKPMKAAKTEPQSSQPDITQECVTISRIRSHGLSILSGVGKPEPGIEAVAKSYCPVTAQIIVTVGYFDGRGNQIGSGLEIITVATGATYPFYHQAGLNGLDRGRMKVARVISIKVYPE